MNDSSRLHIPVTLTLGKEPLEPTSKKLGGLQSWSEYFREEEDLLPLPGNQTQNCLAWSLVLFHVA
jgi:hypothetical protein